MQHPIFDEYPRETSVSTGKHLFDFLGVRTQAAFRKGWEKHVLPEGRSIKPGLPQVNEHYFDWIALLSAVSRTQGVFRMAELGAGWAPWLVAAATASRHNKNISRLELLAIEADATHYGWIKEHFSSNGLNPDYYHILQGAASDEGGTLRFPVVDNPDENYGASLNAARGDIPYVEVRAYALPEILEHFTGPVDLVHVDIQGAEYNLLPSKMDLLTSNVKSIMIGTHISDEKHNELADSFRQAGWDEVMNFPRSGVSSTDFGDVKFDDGFLLYNNPKFIPKA